MSKAKTIFFFFSFPTSLKKKAQIHHTINKPLMKAVTFGWKLQKHVKLDQTGNDQKIKHDLNQWSEPADSFQGLRPAVKASLVNNYTI